MVTRIPVLLLLLAALIIAPLARAAERVTLIRDAEIENTIRVYATPIFRAAGLDAAAVRVHLVKDGALNAFVAGGLNLFLNTGLLIRAEDAGQVLGVIAHETGHIAGGHLVRLEDAFKNATAEAIAAMVLGAAAAAATGKGEAAAAIMMGGGQMAQRGLLAYTRGQEQAADQAAVTLLDSIGLSSQGLLSFMEILQDQDLLVAGRQDPYLRTHPLSRDRVTFLRHHVETSRAGADAAPPDLIEPHERMRAKLFAFIETPARTLQRYKEEDQSLAARYARAIAHYRRPDLDKALPLIDGLIRERPRDPFFHELKGQMLFENGRPKEALAAYREAVRILPEAALLRIGLAQVQVELEGQGPAMLDEAQEHLTFALRSETDNRMAWHLLAIAHGRLGNEGLAAAAMAEEAWLRGRLPDVLYHTERAGKLLEPTSPARLRADDLRQAALRAKDERKR